MTIRRMALVYCDVRGSACDWRDEPMQGHTSADTASQMIRRARWRVLADGRHACQACAAELDRSGT